MLRISVTFFGSGFASCRIYDLKELAVIKQHELLRIQVHLDGKIHLRNLQLLSDLQHDAVKAVDDEDQLGIAFRFLRNAV